jgi:hypothetical protein
LGGGGGQGRAYGFGVRHPRLGALIVCVLLAGVIAVDGFQLGHGTYLGWGWGIAALAGMAAAAGFSASAVVSIRRHGSAVSRALMAWLVLGLASTAAIGFPFPQGPYGGAQAFFNVVHAALLGFEAVTCGALIALFAYALRSPRGRSPRGRARRPAAPGGNARRRAGHAPRRARSRPRSGSRQRTRHAGRLRG